MNTLRSLLIIALFGATACGKKSFETAQPSVEEPPVIIDPIGPNGEVCPRYDLIVVATDQRQAHRNYKFIYNSEMKKTATEGEIEITFNQDSSTRRYTLCSGDYVNTVVSPSLKPLNVTESLTKEVTINVGRICSMQLPLQQTTIQVVDAANGKILFDEQKLRQQIGSCEFGYTSAGQAMRDQLVQFAHGAVDLKAALCNK
ncbi:hypothetical protein K2X05_07750 [bacterium]|nr:hypothetical protein [bacterium]